MGKAWNLVSCASAHRINEEFNGRFQKYTLLILKKLVIDLPFLLEVNTVIKIYKQSMGSLLWRPPGTQIRGAHRTLTGHPRSPETKARALLAEGRKGGPANQPLHPCPGGTALENVLDKPQGSNAGVCP